MGGGLTWFRTAGDGFENVAHRQHVEWMTVLYRLYAHEAFQRAADDWSRYPADPQPTGAEANGSSAPGSGGVGGDHETGERSTPPVP
jgi:hypothetical protein